MDRYTGTCEPLQVVDVSRIVAWLNAIPIYDWPQQDRLSAEYPYPAMVSNLAWHGFGHQTDPLVTMLMTRFPGHVSDHRMLSIVVPGQKIAGHDDVQSETWRVRIHVPLITNPKAVMYLGKEAVGVHMEVGTAYLVNTEVWHSLENLGAEPRIHLFWDVRAPA